MIELYGIPNCNTMKKARVWLDQHALAYTIHSYKREGVDRALLEGWVDRVGWELLLNKRGTTWRKLDADEKEGIDRDKAIALMVANPSMIKRPVLVYEQHVEVGFSPERYAEVLLHA